MKQLLTVILLFTGASLTFSQTHGVCGTDAHNEKLKLQFPNGEQEMHELILRAQQNQQLSGDRAAGCIIPVVVHVVHDGGVSNISVDQIQSALDILTEDYTKMNDDTLSVRNTSEAPYLPIASNMNISFELAKLDPNGNCTNGVQRRNSPTAGVNANDDVKSYALGGLDAWPRDRYMNIWVVTSIEGSGQGITLGYAQFPYFGAPETYGVVIRHDRMGDMGTALSGDRTLTHELGHCLGLLHTFQDGCSSQDCSNNGDYCCDTPPVDAAQWSCSLTQNTCLDIPTNDPYGFDAFDQFENYMSYSPCQYMFSEDQKNIVTGNLTGFDWMDTLTNSHTQVLTGVGTPAVLCQAQFSSTETMICAGSSIDFTDESFSNVTGHTWTFTGGTPSTSTQPNPTVVYNTPGVYPVTLEVTDGSSSITKTEIDYIQVMANPGTDYPPVVEGFEGLTTLSDNFEFFTYNGDAGETWKISTNTGTMGSQSAWIDNFGINNGSVDQLISAPIDLSGVASSDPLIFTFKYAYRKRSTSTDEWMRFYVSNDCGETWILRKALHGSGLSDEILGGPYVPAEEDWIDVSVTNINSTFHVSNFRYMIEFENDGGNNFYLDNINIYPTSMTGINEQNKSLALNCYPNPASDNVTINLTVDKTAEYSIELTNVLGESISTLHNGVLTEGMHSINYNSEGLANGSYFINFKGENFSQSIKLLIAN